ncbi:MAG: hypothetical protein ACREOB_11055, partial [Thermodesulfobacteriota bacterium]
MPDLVEKGAIVQFLSLSSSCWRSAGKGAIYTYSNISRQRTQVLSRKPWRKTLHHRINLGRFP